MEGRHRTEEAKTWMQEYFRWHLRREDRPSVEGLSKEMREKVNVKCEGKSAANTWSDGRPPCSINLRQVQAGEQTCI